MATKMSARIEGSEILTTITISTPLSGAKIWAISGGHPEPRMLVSIKSDDDSHQIDFDSDGEAIVNWLMGSVPHKTFEAVKRKLLSGS